MLIAQISDCHIVEPGAMFADRVDSAAALRSAIETIRALPLQPDVVLLTGDLVNDGTSVQYDHLMELLGPLDLPLVPIPGNHDDRTELRKRFADVLPAGAGSDPIDLVVDVGVIRIVALDTTIPGRHDGALADTQLAWLDRELTAVPDRPTIVAQHHPPATSGIPWMDDTCGFADGRREAAIISRHVHVEAVVSGHLHRCLQQRFAGTISVTCPSTASQLELGLGGGAVEYTTQPTGIMLHHWRPDHGLVSHMVPIGPFDVWSPSWAE